MKKTIRIQVALAVAVLLAGAMGFAQSSGEATYVAKCQNCHGANGMADTAVGKAMKIKPITDPAVKKMNEAEMVAAAKKGMASFKDKVTDEQIKGAVAYFRTFIK